MLKTRLLFVAIVALSMLSCSKKTTTNAVKTPTTNATTNNKRQLIWSDEFNYKGLPDSTKWSYDVGGRGWGNNELQFYTEKRLENARVEGGNLIIEAQKENWDKMKYTSARLVTKNKGDFLYGRIEARAKLPKGLGTWPAIWMLPTDWSYGGWPESGEIDIMEHVGYDQDVVHGTVHTKAFNHTINTQKANTIKVAGASDSFHVYAIDWSENQIDFFMDDIHYFTFKKEDADFKKWPFDKRFHIIFNIAFGGNWGGSKGIDDTILPQKMEIDWVRVYK